MLVLGSSGIGLELSRDDVLRELDGQTWVACLHLVGHSLDGIADVHTTAVDRDAVALDVLHAETFVDGDEAAELEDGLQERLLSLRLKGGCRVKLLLRSRLLGRLVLDALVEVLDLLKGQLYTALREGTELDVEVSEGLVIAL